MKKIKDEEIIDLVIDINEVLQLSPSINTEELTKKELINEIKDIIKDNEEGGLIHQDDIEDLVEESKETLIKLGYDVNNIEQYKITDKVETDENKAEKYDDEDNDGVVEDNNKEDEKPKEKKKEVKQTKKKIKQPKKEIKKTVKKEVKQTKIKKESSYTRSDAFIDILRKQKGEFSVISISNESDKLFVEKTGKTSSYGGAKNYATFGLPILLRLGIVKKIGSRYKYIG